MPDPYELRDTTKARIGKHARPFVDTFDSVVNRILDVYEQVAPVQSDVTLPTAGELKDFDPATPPNLTHTKVLSITFNGKHFNPEMTTWNALLWEAIRVGREKIQSDEELKRAIAVNFVFGRKEEDGYRYLKDVDLSVQGQDSNGAWKGTFSIARKLGLTFDVVFAWREKEGAVNPGIHGRFRQNRLHKVI
jgi:hypothetical protein